MAKIRMNKSQNAQGMVEFALVLPILLMLILGVFAFGHLFYVYSSVVSASREAARWGAATGESAGANSLPRYQNCDEIRAAAARVAPISGITQVNSPDENTPGVQITFDSGPGTAVKGNCNTSTGPEVDLGDRIVVTVRVRYAPIVPLIPIPSFMLQANTARTIIKDMAVGVAPSAVPVRNAKLQMTINPTSGVVGENVTITITATGTDQAPVGTIALTGDTGNVLASCSPLTLVSGGGYTSTATCVQKYNAETIVYLKAVYDDPTDHFDPVTITKTLMVHPSAGVDTKVDVSPDPGTSTPDRVVSFTAKVDPVSGNGKPDGVVRFHLFGDPDILCEATVATNGTATCSTLKLDVNHLGSNFLSADYISTNTTLFHNSTTMFAFIIIQYETEIAISSNPNPPIMGASVTYTARVSPIDKGVSLTPTGTVTISIDGSTPDNCKNLQLNTAGEASCTINVSKAGETKITATYSGNKDFKASSATITQQVQNTCPTLGAISFATSSLQYSVSNRNGAGSVNVSEIDVIWPNNLPSAKLQQINLGSNNIWTSKDGLDTLYPDPQNIPISSGSAGISSNQTPTMLLSFNSALPKGEYSVVVKFSNGCSTPPTSKTLQ